MTNEIYINDFFISVVAARGPPITKKETLLV